MLEGYKLFCITFRSNDTGRDYNYSCVAKTAEKAIEMFRKKNGDRYQVIKVQSQEMGR